MHFLEYYYDSTVQYNLIQKFKYKDTTYIPKLKKIVLSFTYPNSEFKNLIISLLALELITEKKSFFTYSKKVNIRLKIRKGSPIGCKVILQNKLMYQFLFKLLTDKYKGLKKVSFLTNEKNFTISYHFSECFSFPELKKHYYLFNKLPNLQVVISTNAKTRFESVFLLNSFKLPTKV